MEHIGKILVFFLIYLNVGISTSQDFEPTVTFSLDKLSITKFPWMVIISNSTSMISYGSLVHPRAVLTLELHEIESAEIDSLRVYANCFFGGPINLFQYKLDCSVYRRVTTSNTIERFQNTSTSKLSILTLSEPFVINEDVGVVRLNRRGRHISEFDCGVLSLKTFRNSQTRATFFSLTQTLIFANRTNVKFLGLLNSPNLVLYNTMGEEYYEGYENVELHFPGSPLVCKSTKKKILFQYVLVGVVNLNVKSFKNPQNGLNDIELSGEVKRIDGRQIDMQELLNKIIELT